MFYHWMSYYLGDANTVDPLLEGSDVITAEVLDVLRLLLDLRVLHTRAEFYLKEHFVYEYCYHDWL